MNKIGTMKYLTVEDINDYEQDMVITSPRSIEACFQEGIKPRDLLYIPQSEFRIPNIPEEIRHIHYEFFEAKRKEILYKVRKTRKILISESEGITRSSTAAVICIPHRPNKEIFKAKNVKTKNVIKIVDREKILEQVAREREIEHIEKLEKEFSSSVILAENSRKRFFKMKEAKKEREKKAEKEIEENEKYRRYMDQKRLNKIQKIIEIAKEKWKIIESKKEENDMKIKKHNEKMEKRLAKIAELRKKNMNESDAREKEIIDKIINEKIKKQKMMEEKWNLKMQVKENLKVKLKEEITNKQLEYYTLKQSIDKKYEEFLLEKNKPRFFEVNPEKINKTALLIESEIKDKKGKFERKIRKSEVRIQNSNLKILQNIAHKKNLIALKKLKQDWNIERLSNKEKYLQTLNINKYQAKLEKINEIEIKKSIDLENTMKNTAKFEIMNNNLSEAIIKMTITKDWDKEVLINIIKDEENVTKNNLIRIHSKNNLK